MRNLLVLFAIFALFTGAGLFAQDTTALEPVSHLPVRNILSIENDLLIASQRFWGDDFESESLYVYDISNPSEPLIVDRGFPIRFLPQIHVSRYDWHTGAVILDSLIVTCTTHRIFYRGDQTYGPVELLGRWMGEEENLWEIMIQEQFEGNSRHPGNMVLYENYLILAAGLRGVRIYDLSNPEEPEEVNVLIYSCDRIVLVGDRLLVYRVNTLRLLDISDPEAPELIGQLTIGNEE